VRTIICYKNLMRECQEMIDEIKLCSYCLGQNNLNKVIGLGDICKICVDSYFPSDLEIYFLENSKESITAIKPIPNRRIYDHN
jgi:hypothetical protein